ncbi:hypothetical protein NM688_g7836 [Phlebia brevispora]|uniref:Uncharacterized protein n=1 Tax=Phlebia brevispora TaxID=194682 RepID=A0ACC1S0L6_9APHY|nr:hypothetical protein NM688_g7836 [Phlebia brevispora]
MQGSTDIDQAIRVVVSPSQASYFAGEPFVVTVTITNLRTPQATGPPRSVSNSPYYHKRGAHSVSYVPMARPPTSPGIRTALPVPRQSGETDTLMRKGVIGRSHLSHNDLTPPQPDAVKKRPVVNKSLSVSITTHDLPEEVLQDAKGKSPVRSLNTSSYVCECSEADLYFTGLLTSPAPSSPLVPSPLGRSSTVPVNHPHARKHSVLLDGEVQVQDVHPSVPLPTPNPSSSTFSLSLDPISESNSSPMLPASPAVASPHPNGDFTNFRQNRLSSSSSAESALNGLRQSSMLASPPRKPPLLGLPNGHAKAPNTRKSLSSSFPSPNSELILYSYAQLVGTLSIVSLSDAAPSPDQVQTMHTLRSALAKTKGVGGGSMDIASHTPQSLPYGHHISSRRLSHSRSTSLTVGLFSMLSPSALLPPSPTLPPSHARSQSLLSAFFGSSSSYTSSAGLGLGMNDDTEPDLVDPETPLPTFEVQPKMLAVDLTLGPGESRCYTYQLDLPRNLPPTYRGRCLRFSYEFILGICRALPRSPSGPSTNSRVLKVPIRLYNHVVVDRPPSPYDLLWPVQSRGEPINVSLRETPAGSGPLAVKTTGASDTSSNSDLRIYAKSLMASAEEGNGHLSVEHGMDHKLTWSERDRKGLLSLGVDEEDGEPSCREAVEILTRNPKKLSYDVNKDGVKVAVLTFTKSAYRLGETVMGVIELNRRAGRSRVLKVGGVAHGVCLGMR